MAEVARDRLKHGGVPVARGPGTEALWVDFGDDGHGHLSVREVDAANAALVRKHHTQVVGVLELGCVAGRLQRGHLELVRLRDLLELALLLLFAVHLVLDLV